MLAIIGPALQLLVLILTEVFSYLTRQRVYTEQQKKEIAKEFEATVAALKKSLEQKRDINSTLADLDQRIEDETKND